LLVVDVSEPGAIPPRYIDGRNELAVRSAQKAVMKSVIVEIITDYFASSGTGQINAVFPLT